MNRNDVLRLVDEEVALNAVTEARQFPPATRFALDVARTGACGSPPPREEWAKTAQMLGEREEHHAASDALLDLSWVFQHGDPETCAAALGGVWRAQNPFRAPKDGDPLDVLVPQLEDAPAARALDRAARLKMPPVRLLRRAGEIEDPLPGRIGRLGSPPEVPYSRSLALGLLGAAKQEIASLSSDLAVFDEVFLDEFHKEDIEELGSSVARAYERIEHLRANADAGMLHQTAEYTGELAYDVAMFKEPAEERLEKTTRALESAHQRIVKASQQVDKYASAYLRDRELREALRRRDRAQAALDYINRMYESAKAVDRAAEYVIAFKNLAGELENAESLAEDAYKACANWSSVEEAGYGPTVGNPHGFDTKAEACELAKLNADEVERLRGLFPEFYSEDERRFPWRDKL